MPSLTSQSDVRIREIKRFSVKTYNLLVRLVPQLSPNAEIPEKDHVKEIIKSKDIHLFVAEENTKVPLGMFTLVSYRIPTGTRVWIEDVVVDSEKRGKGTGEKMMLFAITFAKSLGAREIDLTSRPERKAANKLYRKLGFVIRETNAYRLKLE